MNRIVLNKPAIIFLFFQIRIKECQRVEGFLISGPRTLRNRWCWYAECDERNINVNILSKSPQLFPHLLALLSVCLFANKFCVLTDLPGKIF